MAGAKHGNSKAYRRLKDDAYYYALYHMLAHWTDYLTILVLLLTVGVLWSTSQSAKITHPVSAAVGLAVFSVLKNISFRPEMWRRR